MFQSRLEQGERLDLDGGLCVGTILVELVSGEQRALGEGGASALGIVLRRKPERQFFRPDGGSLPACPGAGFSPGVGSDLGLAAETNQQELGGGQQSRRGVEQRAAFRAGKFAFLDARAQLAVQGTIQRADLRPVEFFFPRGNDQQSGFDALRADVTKSYFHPVLD